jgi:prephenate dehydratase
MTDRLPRSAGTFTETAARLITGGDADLVACADVTEVVRAVEAGEVERGVVPIENTSRGRFTPRSTRSRSRPTC